MRRITIITILFFSLQNQLFSQVLWQITKDTVLTYYYEDGDEFNDRAIRRDKWDPNFGWANSIASNKEQQYYSYFENHEVKEGCLNLTVTKKNVNARVVDWMKDNDSIKDKGKFIGYNKKDFKYTGGLIQSKKQYGYGYFEIKFKAPKESGLWPAFWLYGGTESSEIDLMELNGVHQDQIHVDTHCPNKCDYVRANLIQNRSFGGWIKLTEGLDESFNIVSGIWDEDQIRFYVNGELIATSKVKFAGLKPLVANVAVPSNDGPFHPGPDTNIVNFSPMVIDYIRVWNKDKSKMQKDPVTDSDNQNKLGKIQMKRTTKWLYGKTKKSDNKCVFISAMRDRDGFVEVFKNGAKETCKVRMKDASGNIVFEKEVTENEFKIPVKPETRFVLEVECLNRVTQFIY